jgi:hypothetical protein
MKTSFVKAMGYLILFLSIFNLVLLMVYGFTGRILIGSLADPGGTYVFGTSLVVNNILAALFVYEFQKPKDTGSWVSLVVVWGFNIFSLLIGWVFVFGAQAGPAVYFIVSTITMVIDVLAFFPYEAFRKREAKPQ